MMAEPMSDEELYQLTGSWEAAAALRDEQARNATQSNAQASSPAANVATPSGNFTLDDLKALYKQKGATEARENVTEQGTNIDYIPIQYGNGWSAFENDNRKIIDYIGQGMDATPVYDDAAKTLGGFSRQEGDYVYNYSPEGDYLGRTKWNESNLKTLIRDLGPLAMAAVTMGGGGAFLGNSLFGLTGSAASAAGGALAGGINAYGNDQDILKGALLGGVSGAGTAKLTDILGADALGGTFKNATLGDVTKAINFAKDPTLAGAANIASPYLNTNFNIGDTGISLNDVVKGVGTAQALGSGNNKQVFDAITGLAKTYGGPASSGVDNSTVGNFEDTEITRLKGLGYSKDQINSYFDKLDNLTDIFDNQDAGIPADIGTKSLSSVGLDKETADFLETIGIKTIDDIKDSGLSNQDILDMIGLGADNTVTVTSDRPTGLGDFMVPTSNIGDQGEMVITGNKNGTSLDDFLSLNTPVGNITNNYTDDLNELVITGNKNGTSLNDFITLNDIVGDTTSGDTVLVTGKTDKTDTTDTTKDDDVEELVVVDDKIKGCAPGFHDDGTGFCVPDDDVKEDGCPEGYVLDLETNQCVKVGDTKVTVPPKAVVPAKKKTTEELMANLGLNAPMPSQDPYANIKLMEELFGGDTAYKLRALGAPKNLASSDMDALARLLRNQNA
jgi:hypothetical protein